MIVGLDHHVGRLQIAMHDAFVVRRLQPIGNIARDAQRFRRGQRTICETRLKRFALDELHRNATRAIRFLEAVDLRDVAVVQRCEDARLALEAREAVGIGGDFDRKELQRDVAIELGVMRAIDLAHAACADRLTNVIGSDVISSRRHLFRRSDVTSRIILARNRLCLCTTRSAPAAELRSVKNTITGLGETPTRQPCHLTARAICRDDDDTLQIVTRVSFELSNAAAASATKPRRPETPGRWGIHIVGVVTTNCAPIDRARQYNPAVIEGPTEPASMSVDDISQLLRAWSDGDQLALDELTPIVYAELRRLAHRYMRRERPDHGLQTTALVNEAYIRLVDYKRMQWQNRAHFFAVSAQLMRRILVEHARRHNLKRGRGVQHVSLDEAVLVGVDPGVDLVALDDALNALARVDPRKVRVVEMRFFGGLSVEETAMVLKVSPVTVRRDWSSAKIWLYRELTGETDDGLGSLETAR